MIDNLHLDFLSLKGGCRGLSKSTLVKMSSCWKSHAAAHMAFESKLWITNRGSPKLVQQCMMMAHNVHSGVVFESKLLITISTWIMAFAFNLKWSRVDAGTCFLSRNF